MDMVFLREDSASAMIHTQYKNQKDTCDYKCEQQFSHDMFMQPKVNVCKANCDVVWTNKYIRQLQDALAREVEPKQKMQIRNRIDSANKQLFNARRRLFKTKLTLKKVLYGRRASMSMKPVKNGPAFEKGMN